MSDTSVSFKVGAEVVGQPAVDRLAVAVERLRQEQEMLQQRATEVARVAATLTAAEVQAAAAFRSAADAVELKAAAMGLSVGQLHTMEQAEQRAAATAAALAAQEQRAAVETAQLAAASRQLTDAERKVAAAMRATEQAAEMKAKALGVSVGQLRSVEQAAQGMAKNTNGAANAAGNLRFQMFDVVQQLSAGQNPMMIANQQGFQIAQAFSAAGQSGATMGQTIMAALGPIAAILPIVAVAAAGVALAYQGLTAESEQAAAVQAAFGRSAKATAEIMDDATDSIRRLKLITAGASKEAIAASDSWAGLRDRYEEATKASDALVKSNAKILASKGVPESWDVAIGTVSRGMGDLADAIDRVDGGIAGLSVNTGLFAFLTSAMDGMSTSTAELKEQTYAEIGAMMQARGATVLAYAARNSEAAATKNQTAAGKEGTETRKEGTDAIEDHIAAMQLAAEVESQAAAANAATFAAGLLSLSEMADAARAAALTEEQRIEATAAAKIRVAGQTLQRIRAIVGIQASAMETAEAEHQAAVTAIQKEASDARDALRESDMQKAADSFTESLSGLVPPSTLTAMEKLHDLAGKIGQAYAEGAINAEQFAKLSGMVGQAQTGITTAQTAAATASTAGKVGQAISSPLAAAASLHPIAQAVLAGLQSAANMQDGKSVFTEAADLITDALANLGPFVESAFAAVGDIIAQAPRLLIESLPDILEAVADGIPAIAQAVADAVPAVLTALAEALPRIVPELVIVIAQILLGAVPMIAIALASAVLDPAFYEALAEAFARGIEAAFDRIGQVGEDLGQTLGTGTTAGGGFQLFGLPIVPAPSGGSGGGSVVIQPGDLWGDFTRSIDIELSKLGRT